MMGSERWSRRDFIRLTGAGGAGWFLLGRSGATSSGHRPSGQRRRAPVGASGQIAVFDSGPFPGNTPELGVMLVTNGDRGSGNRGGSTDATDTIILKAG